MTTYSNLDPHAAIENSRRCADQLQAARRLRDNSRGLPRRVWQLVCEFYSNAITQAPADQPQPRVAFECARLHIAHDPRLGWSVLLTGWRGNDGNTESSSHYFSDLNTAYGYAVRTLAALFGDHAKSGFYLLATSNGTERKFEFSERHIGYDRTKGQWIARHVHPRGDQAHRVDCLPDAFRIALSPFMVESFGDAFKAKTQA